MSGAFRSLGPITLEERVAAFVYEPEAIEDLTHLMD